MKAETKIARFFSEIFKKIERMLELTIRVDIKPDKTFIDKILNKF